MRVGRAVWYDQTAWLWLLNVFSIPATGRSSTCSSKAPGPQGSAPITPEMLLHRPSGDLFGWTQNAGMGWDPALLGGKEFLILSTHGGIRAADGTPVALGYHTGHWEVGLLMEAAAQGAEVARRRAVRRVLHRPLRRPHAGHYGDVRFPALSQRRRHRFPAA